VGVAAAREARGYTGTHDDDSQLVVLGVRHRRGEQGRSHVVDEASRARPVEGSRAPTPELGQHIGNDDPCAVGTEQPRTGDPDGAHRGDRADELVDSRIELTGTAARAGVDPQLAVHVTGC
jgi:hypothetical protein